jgi:hypothetical protein
VQLGWGDGAAGFGDAVAAGITPQAATSNTVMSPPHDRIQAASVD